MKPATKRIRQLALRGSTSDTTRITRLALACSNLTAITLKNLAACDCDEVFIFRYPTVANVRDKVLRAEARILESGGRLPPISIPIARANWDSIDEANGDGLLIEVHDYAPPPNFTWINAGGKIFQANPDLIVYVRKSGAHHEDAVPGTPTGR